MKKKIEIPYAGIRYAQGNRYSLKVITWIMAEKDDTVGSEIGLVVIEEDDDMNEVLSELYHKSPRMNEIMTATVVDFSELIEGLMDEHTAYHILKEFDENVDKYDGDR